MGRVPLPRFALLFHRTRGSHYDLLVERPRRCWTWRLAKLPLPGGHREPEAVRIADHQKLYLDYEGPVSGGRGRVRQVDRGTVVSARRDGTAALEVVLRGTAGRYRLRLPMRRPR